MHTLELDKIDDHFPKESYREGQKKAIEFAVQAFNDGKKFVILECPTGSGKSVTGMTIADMVDRSYYLTSSKNLQDQLVKDFSDVTELKGRSSYPCTFWQRFGDAMVTRLSLTKAQLSKVLAERPDCNRGYCRKESNAFKATYSCAKCFTVDGPVGANSKSKMAGELVDLPNGMEYSACPYYEQVFQAINNRKVVMNFSSFLYQTQMTTRFDKVRDLLIIDEAHTAESQLLDFVAFSINDKYLQRYGIIVPHFESPHEYALWFIECQIDQHIGKAIQQAKADRNDNLEDELSRMYRKFKMFMDNILADDPASTPVAPGMTSADNWICEYSLVKGDDSFRSVTIKPIFINKFATPLLFRHADRVLLMSATVLDVNVVCKSLGIKKSEVASYRMKNRFPVKNRPIYLDTVAKMVGGKDKMGVWGPKLVKKVEQICNKYKNKKGIIHTHNFAIMDYIVSNANQATTDRLLNQKNYRNKSDMLVEHARSKDSIIIAPAMHEGVDLAGELSRFQILCKVPYPNFYDNEQLSRRMEVDKGYYNWLVALKLIQSCGRSVRSETDWADTYIIDESIFRFLEETKSILPSWFTEAIVKL